MKKELLDCRGRNFDDIILYGGYDLLSSIDSDDIRNHTYNSRIKGKIPKNGKYYLAEEVKSIMIYFGWEDNNDLLSLINTKFKNVQYIRSDKYIFWLYCINKSNLDQFTFIGENLSINVLDMIMRENKYKLGCIKEFPNEICRYVYYNPDKLYILSADYRIECGCKIADDIRTLYRLFEADEVTVTSYTGGIFNSEYQVIPLILPDEKINNQHTDFYYWVTSTGIMMSTDGCNISINNNFINEQIMNSIVDIDDTKEMIRLLFNIKL